MQLRLEHKVRMPNGTYMLVDDIEKPTRLSRDELYERYYQDLMLFDMIDRTINHISISGSTHESISEKGFVVAHTNQ